MTTYLTSDETLPRPEREPDYLRQLFAVIGADYVLMIQAFFDESGTDAGSLVTCVAGYLFETEQCLRFNSEWKEVLDRYGLKYFHMNECAHGVGEFTGRGKDEAIEIETRLIGIIKRRALFGLVTSVCEADYLATAIGRRQYKHEGAYVLCLQWCMTGVAAWVDKHKIQGKVAYFFEAGHSLQSIANNAMASLATRPAMKAACLYHSHTFIGKEDAMPVQAADLLAWQWHKDWDNRFGEKRRPRRADLASLLDLPHMQCHLDAKGLRAMSLRGGAYQLEELKRMNRL